MNCYPIASVERMMKIQEVILQALAKKMTWWQHARMNMRALPLDGEFRRDAQQDDGRADAEFGQMLQLRHADAFVFKKCAVRGFHVAEPDDVVFDLEGAMPARDFLIVDDDVRVRPSHHDARLLHGIDQAFGRARNDGKGDGLSHRKAEAGVFHGSPARESGRPCASSKVRQW